MNKEHKIETGKKKIESIKLCLNNLSQNLLNLISESNSKYNLKNNDNGQNIDNEFNIKENETFLNKKQSPHGSALRLA